MKLEDIDLAGVKKLVKNDSDKLLLINFWAHVVRPVRRGDAGAGHDEPHVSPPGVRDGRPSASTAGPAGGKDKPISRVQGGVLRELHVQRGTPTP